MLIINNNQIMKPMNFRNSSTLIASILASCEPPSLL
jgi:hypothetical protein